jgi:hypothetical protein
VFEQFNASKCLGAAFFFIFAEEFNLFDHIFQNRINLNELSIVMMAIRARTIVILPAINTRFAEQLILACIALNGLSLLCDDLVTNCAKDEILDVQDLLFVHDAIVRKQIV